ncbi:MAG: type II toxin-antitoxin system RelE/ParE family toxin [Ignavibacteriales bacterium]|nr:type II toxin-antitoxin system RelE/ParE family toxin [Ignavibacteriales bacterium]
MAKINWTAEAEHWLYDIYLYISKDNPQAAASTIQSIFEKAQILQNFPEAGYRYSHQLRKDIRILLFGHYRITYLIKDNGEIDILGVFHGALDIERYL